MKLKNNSTRDYWYDKILLEAGKELEIKDEKAIKVLLNQEGVSEVVDKKEVEELKAKVKELEAKSTKRSKK